jgi:hypothetical protein
VHKKQRIQTYKGVYKNCVAGQGKRVATSNGPNLRICPKRTRSLGDQLKVYVQKVKK